MPVLSRSCPAQVAMAILLGALFGLYVAVLPAHLPHHLVEGDLGGHVDCPYRGSAPSDLAVSDPPSPETRVACIGGRVESPRTDVRWTNERLPKLPLAAVRQPGNQNGHHRT